MAKNITEKVNESITLDNQLIWDQMPPFSSYNVPVCALVSWVLYSRTCKSGNQGDAQHVWNRQATHPRHFTWQRMDMKIAVGDMEVPSMGCVSHTSAQDIPILNRNTASWLVNSEKPHFIMHSILTDPLSPYIHSHSSPPPPHTHLPFRHTKPKTHCVNWLGLHVSLWKVQHQLVNLQMLKNSEWILTSFKFTEQQKFKSHALTLVSRN